MNAKLLKKYRTLKTYHEGTSHVKETRIDIVIRKFELFEMNERETIDEMYSRFTTIVNEMSKKGKEIALKSSQESVPTQTTEELEETGYEDSNEEIALLSKRIQRMMRRKDQSKKGFPNKKENPKIEVDKSQITCFGYNKLGHYKAECPLCKRPQKRFPFKKKSMMATWDESDESDVEEDEEANICLMAKAEENEVGFKGVKKKPWLLDSGCSRHMTGDKNCFMSFVKKDGGSVTFENNNQAQIKGKGIIDDNSIQHHIDALAWTPFLQIFYCFYPDVVRAFYYKSQTFPEKSLLVTILKGIEIMLTPNILASILDLPNDGPSVFGKNWN
ncbi:uncharacterized protein [Cicer arietinum]|uniref:uncharacterized protein n=1 Tax=Cicer arietinum TaxID=3827 RepID=UPI003CC62C93